jgi:hypothetical protein
MYLANSTRSNSNTLNSTLPQIFTTQTGMKPDRYGMQMKKNKLQDKKNELCALHNGKTVTGRLYIF